MTPSRRRTGTPFALATALLLALTGCGGGGGDSADAAPTDGPDPAARELIRKVNEAMESTSFHSSGTTTAFAGGRQKTTWDPEKGLRTVAEGKVNGEMYCKDGVNYLSAGLLAASSGQAGQPVEVPEELSEVYVHTDTGQPCTALFRIAETGRLTPERDERVDGRATRAVTVTGSGGEDVYHVAASGQPFVLRLDSRRGESRSTTTFSAFGEPTDVTMPPRDRLVPLEEFRKKTTPAP